MAEKITAKADDKPAQRMTADDLKKGLAEIVRRKDLASDYSGQVGQATKQFVERFGVNKDALTIVRRMESKGDEQRQALLCGFIEMADKLGYFDQIDMFSDARKTLSAITERWHNQPTAKAAPAGNSVSKLM